MSYRTSGDPADGPREPLEPRLANAFDAHRARFVRVTIARLVAVVVVLVVALLVRHWGTWVLFGVVAFLQVPGVFVLLFVERGAQRFRARIEGDVGLLAWLHTAPEPRTKLHRIELHDRVGGLTVLFATAAIAERAAAGARALRHRPAVTTTDAERTAEEPRQRLAAKLVRLDEEASAATAPLLQQQRGAVEQFLRAWRARLDRDDAAPSADIEAGVDRALHLYHASRLGESHRKKMSALASEENFPDALTDVVAPEHFTAEITTLIAELDALATSARPRT